MSPAFNRPKMPRSVPSVPALALVQHGHQYLITDGYENREGISEVLNGYTAVLALHLRYGVPLNLHLSGTLMEAVAWHAPDFFGWVRALHREGLLEVIGSTYSQNIMPLSSPEQNVRQIQESLWLIGRHLGIEPEEVRGFWVPERVWTGTLVETLTDERLANGGYRYILLDDRFAYPVMGRGASARHEFDLGAAPLAGRPAPDGRAGMDAHLAPWVVDGGNGLVAVPISSTLRYCIPPHRPDQMEGLIETVRANGRRRPGGLTVYADDLEKSSGLGPWTGRTWTRPEVDAYERALQWVAESGAAAPTLLTPWLAANPPGDVRPVEPGTFFELAHHMGAGEEYRGWWEDPAWEPYRSVLEECEAVLADLPEGEEGSLADLAWKQLMAAFYETAWHEVEADGVCRPAPWARALAAHARSVFVIAAAAAWQVGIPDDAGPDDPMLAVDSFEVSIVDIDRDGEDEVVLANSTLFAVLSPRQGGRLVYLFHLEGPGRLVIGNPADDWNWQEEANQFMRVPRNHPGAFSDVGYEHDAYRVEQAGSGRDGAFAVLVNQEPGSALAGASKTFRLPAHGHRIEVSYQLPETPERLLIDVALSPDYLTLLRGGRQRIGAFGSNGTRGWRCGPVAVWIRLPADQPLLWERPSRPECGHGMLLTVAAWRSSFSFELGLATQAQPRQSTGAGDGGPTEVRRLTLIPEHTEPAATAIEGRGKGAR